MIRRAALALAVLATSCAAAADVRPGDRDALAGCLASAKAAKRGPETCVGSIQETCMKAPDGETTAGMKECGGREIAAWDERLNAAYKRAREGGLGRQATMREGGRKLTGADILRDAQRAWIVYRDRKCDAAALPMEGGTGAGLLSVGCSLDETARQAIWLDGLAHTDSP